MGNQWEEANRARRVAILVTYFDHRARGQGKDPLKDAANIAKELRETDDQQWASHALLACLKKPPSKTTRDTIIAEYEARASDANAAAGADVFPIHRAAGLH